jgi:hypothetical protein
LTASIGVRRAVAQFDALLIGRKLPSRKRNNDCAKDLRNKEHSMMDVLMLAIACGLFALAIGYTYACERL